MNKSRKNKAGKLRIDLFPIEALKEIAKAIEYGIEKHGARDWEKGYPWRQWYAAAFRHLIAWWGGEQFDKESKLSHLAHVGANICFLLTYERRGIGSYKTRQKE